LTGAVLVFSVLTASLLQADAGAAEGAQAKVGQWTNVSATPRSYHTATRLPNGDVLIAGGCVDMKPDGSCDSATVSSEVFDAKKGVWRATGNLNTARARNSAVLLPSGRVLVIGMEGDDGLRPNLQTTATLSSEIYDPATGHWTKVKPPGSHVFQNLVSYGPGMPDKYESKLTPMNLIFSFYTPSATLLPAGPKSKCGQDCGRVFSVGLFAQLYDPRGDKWETPAQPGPHVNHTSTLLQSGKVLVTADGSREGVNPGEIFDPRTQKWDLAADQPVKRVFQTATLLDNGKVLVAGGLASGGGALATPSAELFDPQTTAAPTTNNSAYASNPKLKDLKVEGSWRPGKPMTTGRMNHAAAKLPDGKVLVVGGNDKFGPESRPLASAEAYDPGTGAWTQAGQMANPRGGDLNFSGANIVVSGPKFTATTLGDGRVLVVGGGPDSAEIFTPVRATLHSAPAEHENSNGLLIASVVAVVLFGFAAWMIRTLQRRHRSHSPGTTPK